MAHNPSAPQAARGEELNISDAHIPCISPSDLPQCPECKNGLLRPGVVWFGESLPNKVLNDIEKWIHKTPKIDLILVIRTSASVFPAVEYVERVREKGARVAVINMDINDVPPRGMREGDWFFQGDVSLIVPEILKGVTGDV
ncbi:hypothetical protein FQN50_000910 [Emmonsiellopsis sp. PD_5]|nr:hypothetical protein FQN50_000910 [Emmonsiellopsis sp. PD_5]